MISFPVPLKDFWSSLPVMEMTFDDLQPSQMSRTAGGETLSADTGTALWQGRITLARLQGHERPRIEALFSVLRRGGRTFLAYDKRRPGPLADPQGRILGAAVPVIAAIPSAREISLAGLPARYILSAGDYLAFDYDSGRRALHQVVDPQVLASPSGTTPSIEVTPPIEPGAVVGTTVSLIRASCHAQFVPGSVAKGTSSHALSEGAAFDFIQTLRRP